MNNINLMGSEDVLRASHNMQQAATDISNAVSNLEYTFSRYQVIMDDWLSRFEEILTPKQEVNSAEAILRTISQGGYTGASYIAQEYFKNKPKEVK